MLHLENKNTRKINIKLYPLHINMTFVHDKYGFYFDLFTKKYGIIIALIILYGGNCVIKKNKKLFAGILLTAILIIVARALRLMINDMKLLALATLLIYLRTATQLINGYFVDWFCLQKLYQNVF